MTQNKNNGLMMLPYPATPETWRQHQNHLFRKQEDQGQEGPLLEEDKGEIECLKMFILI